MKQKLSKGWVKTRLKDIAILIMGQSPPGSSYNSEKKGIPLLNGAADFQEKTISPNQFTISPTKLSKKNDILFCIRATIGKVTLSDKEYCLGRGVAALRVKENIVDKNFLMKILDSELKRLVLQGSTIKGVRKEDLEKIEILVPPVTTQKNIINILENVEKAKELRYEADELTKIFLKSVFYDMFGDYKKFPIYELQNLVEEFRFGSSLKSGSTGYPILGIPNVLGDSLELNHCNKVNLSDKEFENYRLNFGDILFVRTNGNPNYVGRCNIFPLKNSNHVFASYLIRTRIKPDLIDPYFLKTYLELDMGRKEMLSKCRTTAGQYNVNTQGLGSIKIPLPPIDLQRIFTSTVHYITDIKEHQKQSREQIHNLFNNMMQKAFKGELAC